MPPPAVSDEYSFEGENARRPPPPSLGVSPDLDVVLAPSSPRPWQPPAGPAPLPESSPPNASEHLGWPGQPPPAAVGQAVTHDALSTEWTTHREQIVTLGTTVGVLGGVLVLILGMVLYYCKYRRSRRAPAAAKGKHSYGGVGDKGGDADAKGKGIAVFDYDDSSLRPAEVALVDVRAESSGMASSWGEVALEPPAGKRPLELNGGWGSWEGASRHYEKVGRLGRGSSGSCYLVRQRNGGGLFALKAIPYTTESFTDVLQEARVLSMLSQTNIVRHLATHVDGECVYIVMEYCTGGDLGRVVATTKARGESLPEDTITGWFKQAAMGLAYLHEHRVMHRDVKTQNLFLCGDGVVKLGDFGIAKILSGPCEMASTVTGTPLYMAPEILSMRSSTYTFKADIWSLGIVLYELCALSRPFHNVHSLRGLMSEVAGAGVPPLPDSVSPRLRALVTSLLTVSPDERPSARDVLALPWLAGGESSGGGGEVGGESVCIDWAAGLSGSGEYGGAGCSSGVHTPSDRAVGASPAPPAATCPCGAHSGLAAEARCRCSSLLAEAALSERGGAC